jgi:hypothetical protein
MTINSILSFDKYSNRLLLIDITDNYVTIEKDERKELFS